jgi:hypothetical protein
VRLSIKKEVLYSSSHACLRGKKRKTGLIILMSVRVIVSKVLKLEELYVRKKKVRCITGKEKREQWTTY